MPIVVVKITIGAFVVSVPFHSSLFCFISLLIADSDFTFGASREDKLANKKER